MLTQFQEKAQKAIVIAESIAFDFGHSSVGSEHLLLSLLKMKKTRFVDFLSEYEVNDEKIYDDVLRLFGKKDIQPFYMEYSEVVKNILDEAIRLSQIKKETKVSLNSLSIALISQEESVAVELLKKYHVPLFELKKALYEEKTIIHELNKIPELINYNELVIKQQRIMIGREKELQQLLETLCKKEKNNALIIGKAGVGKTALVEKLAQVINNKEVVEMLQNKVVYELNLSSLVAGTKYRGEFEEKLKNLINKVIQAKDVILFIDEIHNLIGAGGAEGAIDASNILKPFLARGDLTIIGATTIEEYYKYFEKDKAMNRRFSLIKINENTKEETLAILQGIKKQYEEYHHIIIPFHCLNEIIDLSEEYLIERVFPDKAIDVLDLSCVKTVFNKEKELSKKNIENVIEEISGIKLNKKRNFEQIEKEINQEIIGQEKAIHILMKTYQALLKYPRNNKPQGVFLLLGRSGMGKTETAKVLAKKLNKHLIKLDMSQYSDDTSVNKIMGSSPGYVGYEDHSLFLRDISLYPNSLILLDEVEKAHPRVKHLFLQIFDEGSLIDNHQRTISFKECLILMTSNATCQNNYQLGFKKQKNNSILKEEFSEEFLNRIDEIIYYKDLNKEDLEKIIQKNAPRLLSKEEKQDILKDCHASLGARPLLLKMKKYLMSLNR